MGYRWVELCAVCLRESGIMVCDGYPNHPKADPACPVCRGGGLLDDGDNFAAVLVPCPCTGEASADVVAKVAKLTQSASVPQVVDLGPQLIPAFLADAEAGTPITAISPEWLLKMAEREGGKCISVGGLVSRLKDSPPDADNFETHAGDQR